MTLLLEVPQVTAGTPSSSIPAQIIEWTVESRKTYADPFNDLDVDVIFRKGGMSWRVPAFWRGGQKWTVRFAPPVAGDYSLRLESTDRGNPDLNGDKGTLKTAEYGGQSELLRHGMLRVSRNQRYFEHVDGTPFFWLGDTWWMGLSDRLDWGGFKELAADRRAKGFTVIQVVAGLVPFEEQGPSDPGFCNEGGCVWGEGFSRINPKYFDAADRRIKHLIEVGLVPAIVGGWNNVLARMGTTKMKQHWRYIIARYGAYPTFWIVGGEVIDPPPNLAGQIPAHVRPHLRPGWSEIIQYIRESDPYHHPVSAHEAIPPLDLPLQDERLSDFDLFQSSHGGWPSLATEVAQMGMHYARTEISKPIVQGEIGYETLGEEHFSNFQRAAFWLSMLNGAAGHTYGANGTFESYTGEKPLHRIRWSFMSWQEGMRLPGSYQIGLGAKLLQRYEWWRFTPHPEWVTPRGTTLLKPRTEISGFDPVQEWSQAKGDFRNSYAAGIPGQVRFIYIPHSGVSRTPPPTVLELELGVRYHAYFWEPIRGIRFDLGTVTRPVSGEMLFNDKFTEDRSSAWSDQGPDRANRMKGVLLAHGNTLTLHTKNREKNAVASVHMRADADAAIVLRYQDPENYIAAIYSCKERSLHLIDRRDGTDGEALGRTTVTESSADMILSAEVRDGKAAASISSDGRRYTTPIVDIDSTKAGLIGLLHRDTGSPQTFDDFELRRSSAVMRDAGLGRQLYDAEGGHRGNLAGPPREIWFDQGPGWDDFGRERNLLLDAYRPEITPAAGDWLLILETKN